MIVAGFGFRASATEDSLRDALRRAAGGLRPTSYATIREKAQTKIFQDFGRTDDAQVIGIEPELLVAQTTASHSTASIEAHGTGSVAEAAALAAAGRNAKLLEARAISADRKATCALARGDGI